MNALWNTAALKLTASSRGNRSKFHFGPVCNVRRVCSTPKQISGPSFFLSFLWGLRVDHIAHKRQTLSVPLAFSLRLFLEIGIGQKKENL